MVHAVFFGAGPLTASADAGITAIVGFFLITLLALLRFDAGAYLTPIGPGHIPVGAYQIADKLRAFGA